MDPEDQIALPETAWWKSLVLPVLMLTSAVALYTYAYVQQENIFPWGAHNFYWVFAGLVKDQFIRTPLIAPLLVLGSTMNTHNFFFTVPLLPVTLLFGDSRTVYITALTVLYMVPYALMLGAISTQFIKGNPARIFATTTLVALSIPAVWAPALRGVPDHAAALIVGIAVYLYLARAATISVRRLIVIGFLLGFAPLVRRHYLYADVAFFVAAGIHQIQLCRIQTSSAMKVNLINAAKRLAIILGAAATTLCTIGFLFVSDLVQHNYPRLYEAFHVSYTDASSYFLNSFGIMVWLMAALGFLLGQAQKTEKQPAGGFVSTFAVANLVIWLLAARQIAIHYTLFFDWFIVFGVAMLIVPLMESRSNRGFFSAGTVAVLLIINMVIGLAPDSVQKLLPFKTTQFGVVSVPEQEGDTLSRIFSANYGPRTRNDVPEVLSLVKFLHEHATKADPIYITFSDVLNSDIVKNAEKQLYGAKEACLTCPEAPSVDSRDSYPLEVLLRSQYVILTHPLSFYIKEKDETVLKMVAQVFDQKWAFADDFEELPEHFRLASNTDVTIYKRVRPTSISTAVATLDKMHQAIARTPGGQSPIVSTGEPPANAMNTDQTKRHEFMFDFSKYPEHAAYLIGTDKMTGNVTVSGSIKSLSRDEQGDSAPHERGTAKENMASATKPVSANFHFSAYRPDGTLDKGRAGSPEISITTTVAKRTGSEKNSTSYTTKFKVQGEAADEYVVVEVTPTDDSRKLKLDNVKISATQL